MKDEPKFSTQTLKAATKIGDIAKSISMDVGPVRSDPEKYGDMILFMLSNGPDVCLIRCTRWAYFVEYYWDAHCGGTEIDYLMIKNVRNFMLYLNKRKFINFDTWDTKITESMNEDGAELEGQLDDFLSETDPDI